MQHWSSISSLCLFTFVALLQYSATSWGIEPDPTDTFPISSRTLIPWWFSSSLLASLTCSGQPSIEVMTGFVLVSPGTCTFTRPFTQDSTLTGWRRTRQSGEGKIIALHCNENPLYIFLFWEKRDLSPNFNIHVSVSGLYNPRIGLHFLQQKRETDRGNI